MGDLGGIGGADLGILGDSFGKLWWLPPPGILCNIKNNKFKIYSQRL